MHVSAVLGLKSQAGRTILSEYAGLLSNASWASGQSVQLYLSLSLADQVQILTILIVTMWERLFQCDLLWIGVRPRDGGMSNGHDILMAGAPASASQQE